MIEEEIIKKHLPALTRAADINIIHEYKGYDFHKFNSACGVEIWKMEDCAVVLLTDIGQGTSVTNAAETIIVDVYRSYLDHYPKERCLFIETYDLTEGVDAIIPAWKGEEVIGVAWQRIGKIVKPEADEERNQNPDNS